MTYHQPKVSIIIPVFNGSNYLQDAIESALRQTYNNIEIIVINDGSDDQGQTEAIALSYQDNIRYYKKDNGGVASALNLGIQEMTGDYFSWLSHDDIYLDTKVESQIEALRYMNDNKVILYGDYSVFLDDLNKDILCKVQPTQPDYFRYWITTVNTLHGCTLLVPKAAFEEHGQFDTSLITTQDYDMWFRLSKTYKFIHLPFHLVKARSHTEQGSVKLSNIVNEECNDLLIKFTLQLTPQELVSATKRSLPLSYANIASSMWYRSYRRAAMVAAKCTLKSTLHGSLLDNIFALTILLKGSILQYLIQPIRVLYSPYYRKKIKRTYNQLQQIIKSKKNQKIPVESIRELSLKDKFSTVYRHNLFKGRISRSGEGSDMLQTHVIRTAIPKIIQKYNINTILDAPCGDWYWMKETVLNIKHYIGVDIVDDLIEKNKKQFGNDQVEFKCLNLVNDPIPKADLVFSRDCLVHLSFNDALKVIDNIKRSGAKYLLMTTFTQRKYNKDLGSGFWRTLNLQLPPFNFPKPLSIINEQCSEENYQYSDKSLGLWLVDDLK